jgi:hypothetical protein
VGALIAIAACGVAGSCAAPGVGTATGVSAAPATPVVQAQDNRARVASLMSGNFSNAAQAHADSSYFCVELHVAPIWTDRADGPWLYLEQATADEPHQPYRQRIYRLVDYGAGVVEGIVFEFAGAPLVYAGAWKDTSRLNALDPSLLLPRMGCTVHLKPAGQDRFVSLLIGNTCHSDLRGAAEVTSEFTLTSGMIETWDRGYNESGEQIWGPRAGPYQFIEHEPAPAGAAATTEEAP